MIHHKFKTLISSLVFLSLANCANPTQKVANIEKPSPLMTKEEEAQQATNAAIKEIKDQNFVEINFSQSSSVLSKSATSTIETAVQQAKSKGEISQIIVLSWADEEYPSKKLNRLSKSQRSLAQKRNLSIKKYFEGMKGLNIETHNMAERPSTLSKWLNTKDSKLKNLLIAAGLPTTGDKFQYPSKASHSVILIKVD